MSPRAGQPRLGAGRRRRSAVLAPVLLLLFSACSRQPAATLQGTGEADTGFTKTYERGPVTVTLATDRREISIADRLDVSLAVVADETYEVELPAVGEKIQDFLIVDYETAPPKLVDDAKVRYSRSYILEPFLSGEYRIPPMTVRFRKKTGVDDNADDKEHELETEELTIKVTSLLPGDIAEMADIEPPVALPRPAVKWLVPAGAGVLLLLVAAGILLRRRRRGRHARPDTRRPAHEIAYAQLARLVADDLIGAGAIATFYVRISDILRRYIENRFGLHAPERTTEEFLAELTSATQASANSGLTARHRDLLSRFLTHCDLVKFAEYRPENKEIQGTFDTCKAFIEETREDAAQLAAAAAGRGKRD